ncbi:replicative DNA helicase [Amorphus sp. MBR-141]
MNVISIAQADEVERPHILYAQRQLLGAFLSDPEVWGELSFLRPEHFPDPWAAKVLKAFMTCLEAEETPTPFAIAARAEGVDAKSLFCLIREFVSLINVPNLASDLITEWHWSELAAVVAKGVRDVNDRKALDRHQGDYESIVSRMRGQDSDRALVSKAIDALYSRIEAIGLGDYSDGTLSTGLQLLDAKLGGYRKGELVVFAGRPGMGKSVQAICAARAIAHQGRGVALYSLELSQTQVTARLVANEMWHPVQGIHFSRIMKGQLSQAEQRRLTACHEQLSGLPLHIDTRGGLGITDIIASTRTFADWCRQEGKPLGAVVIDYLGLVQASDRYKGRKVDEIGEITGALKALAKEMDITVILLCQLSRQVESREDKRPVLSDLRDSGAIEQDADAVCFLYRPAYYEHKAGNPVAESIANLLEVIIAKNRSGAEGRVDLFIDVACNAIRDEGA